MANIIFMGSPAFAVESLDKIRKVGHLVSAVVTVPDKPAGRKLKMMSSEVKQYAIQHELNILQPHSLKDSEFINTLKELKPDFIVVVAFRKLPNEVIEIPKYATFNVHASLLPQYRGAAPINHAIINGENKTGITTFLLDNNIDTGDIILQKEVDIEDDDDFGSLYDKLKVIGADICVETIDKVINSDVETISQKSIISEGVILKTAPKIFKQDCKINWNSNVEEIVNLIRGLSPIPCAFTEIENQNGPTNLKIFKAYYKVLDTDIESGCVISDNKKHLGISGNNGIVFFTEVQAAGKKRMSVEDFLRGNRIVTESDDSI